SAGVCTSCDLICATVLRIPVLIAASRRPVRHASAPQLAAQFASGVQAAGPANRGRGRMRWRRASRCSTRWSFPALLPRTRWAQEVAMRRFWLGVLATLVTGAVGVLAFLGLGLMPVSADAKPGAFESWLAGFARDAAIERAAPERESPVAATPENLAAAA